MRDSQHGLVPIPSRFIIRSIAGDLYRSRVTHERAAAQSPRLRMSCPTRDAG